MLIDTSVFIAAERGQLDLDTIFAAHQSEPVALAAITASELLHGVHRAQTPEQRALREAFVEQVLAALPVVPFDLVVARIHGRLWAELAAQGITVGAHDLLIAATALSLEVPVATRDVRSFPRIPGLALVQW
jgi:tRNA(fMet)-specific endonuclease VapC